MIFSVRQQSFNLLVAMLKDLKHSFLMHEAHVPRIAPRFYKLNTFLTHSFLLHLEHVPRNAPRCYKLDTFWTHSFLMHLEHVPRNAPRCNKLDTFLVCVQALL